MSRMDGLETLHSDLEDSISQQEPLYVLWQDFQRTLTPENLTRFEDYRRSPGGKPKPVEELTAEQMQAYWLTYYFLNTNQRLQADVLYGTPLDYVKFGDKLLSELTDIVDTSPYLQISKGAPTDKVMDHDKKFEGKWAITRSRIRYLLLDLEATKRENQYLRQMLEIRRPKRKDDQNDGPGSF